MNPHWSDYKALMRGDRVFADSAIAAILFKSRLSALTQFIQKNQSLGKVSAFVMENGVSKKKSSTSSHPLFD
jgi:hypothetical protein